MEATRPGAGSVPPTLGRPQRWLPGQAPGPGPQHHPTARRTGTRVPSPADGADGTRHVGSPLTWEPRELFFFFLFLKKQKKEQKRPYRRLCTCTGEALPGRAAGAPPPLLGVQEQITAQVARTSIT